MNSPSPDEQAYQSDGQPLSLNNDHTTPETRIKDVQSARAIYKNMLKEDQKNSINRAKVQAVADGKPPYDPEKLRRNNQGFRTNLNFGEMASQLEYAMAAYEDMIDSVQNLVRVETKYGDDTQRARFNRIIAEELTRAIKNDTDTYYEQKNLATHFVMHGVGVAYFDDEFTYKYKSTGLDGFKMPGNTRATESEIEVSASKRRTPVHKLYAKIRNEESAKKMGWNVEQVKKSLANARNSDTTNHDYEYERLATEIRNNDLFSSSQSNEVHLVHMWVKEFDGTISHYIFDESNGANSQGMKTDGFLYVRKSKYKNVHQAFTTFCYGIGNGYYSGIKGLGEKAYQHVMTSNRLRSTALDSAMVSASLMVKPKDAKALRKSSINFIGPYAVMDPDVELVNNTVPNLSNNLIPILRDSDQMLNNHLGGYNETNAFNSTRERTRFEVAAQAQAASKLSITAMNLFYQPWERLMREIVRRLTNPSYPSYADGAEVAKDFRKRCLDRGVPIEALKELDHSKTKAERAIGSGSKAARLATLEELKGHYHELDSTGRRNLVRDSIAARVGQDQALRYLPQSDEPRETHDLKVALMENSNMSITGDVIPVLSIENHMDHMQIHLEAMNDNMALLEEGQGSLSEVAQKIMPIFNHTFEHYQFMEGDIMNQSELKVIKQNLQQLGEIIHNGMKQARKEAEEAAQKEGQERPQITEAEMKLIEFRQRLDINSEKAEQDLAIQQAKAQQDAAIKDAKAARELRDFL